MSESRREFLARTAAGIVGAAAASAVVAEAQASAPAPQTTPAAGTPPAFEPRVVSRNRSLPR